MLRRLLALVFASMAALADDEHALSLAVVLNRHDIAAKHAYADALIERGDVYGELIAAELALRKTSPEAIPELRRRITTLRSRFIDEKLKSDSKFWDLRGIHLEFEDGFVVGMVVPVHSYMRTEMEHWFDALPHLRGIGVHVGPEREVPYIQYFGSEPGALHWQGYFHLNDLLDAATRGSLGALTLLLSSTSGHETRYLQSALSFYGTLSSPSAAQYSAMVYLARAGLAQTRFGSTGMGNGVVDDYRRRILLAAHGVPNFSPPLPFSPILRLFDNFERHGIASPIAAGAFLAAYREAMGDEPTLLAQRELSARIDPSAPFTGAFHLEGAVGGEVSFAALAKTLFFVRNLSDDAWMRGAVLSSLAHPAHTASVRGVLRAFDAEGAIASDLLRLSRSTLSSDLGAYLGADLFVEFSTQPVELPANPAVPAAVPAEVPRRSLFRRCFDYLFD